MKSNDLFNAASEAASELDKARATNDFKMIGLSRQALVDAIDDVNNALREECVSKFLSEESPVKAAIEKEFIDVYRFTEKEDKKTGRITTVLDTRKELVDLLALEDAAPNRLFPNGQWIHWVEKFAYNVGAACTARIGGNAERFESAFKLSEAARECDIGAVSSSKTNITKQLQAIADAILFIDNGSGQNSLKVLTVDTERLLAVCCKDSSKSNNVVMPRRDTMIKHIVKAMNRILTNGTYEAE